jgi:hypothetical protein
MTTNQNINLTACLYCAYIPEIWYVYGLNRAFKEIGQRQVDIYPEYHDMQFFHRLWKHFTDFIYALQSVCWGTFLHVQFRKSFWDEQYYDHACTRQL